MLYSHLHISLLSNAAKISEKSACHKEGKFQLKNYYQIMEF